MTNIYLAGKAGSGKDTVADYLIKHYGYTRAKLAYPVYGLARNYFGMTNKNRELLNYIGTLAGREQDENIWVRRFTEDIKIVEQTARELYNKEFNFVTTDVRFENESFALWTEGWLGIYLECPDEERIRRLKERDGDAQESMLNCESERSVDVFKDKLDKIDASGTIFQTFNNVDEYLVKKGVI